MDLDLFHASIGPVEKSGTAVLYPLLSDQEWRTWPAGSCLRHVAILRPEVWENAYSKAASALQYMDVLGVKNDPHRVSSTWYDRLSGKFKMSVS